MVVQYAPTILCGEMVGRGAMLDEEEQVFFAPPQAPRHAAII